MKILSKCITTIAWLVTMLVLVCAGFMVLSKAVFNLCPYVTLSGSMEPIIQTGSIAFINQNDTDVAVGDVVTFRMENGDLVTHRLVDVDENGLYTTKGDANDTEDFAQVSQDQIVGTYAFSIPKLGYVMQEKERFLPFVIIWVVGINVASFLMQFAVAEGEKEKKKASLSDDAKMAE